MIEVHAVLIGGRYDGDEGYIDEKPERLWAFECGVPDCRIQIHWAPTPEDVPVERCSVRYDLVDPEETDAQGRYQYICAGVDDTLLTTWTRDLVTV